MKVKLLMKLEGAVTGNVGDIRIVDNVTAEMLISFQLVEKVKFEYKPKHKPIIVHTRCINGQK